MREYMPEIITNERIYEILKRIQDDLNEIKAILADHSWQFIRIREDISNLRNSDPQHLILRNTLHSRSVSLYI